MKLNVGLQVNKYGVKCRSLIKSAPFDVTFQISSSRYFNPIKNVNLG